MAVASVALDSTLSTQTRAATSSARADTLDRYARRGVWALPIWAALLAAGTLSHQPSPSTDFPAYAQYITTTPFLISHLVASIVGAAIGLIGLIALSILLLVDGHQSGGGGAGDVGTGDHPHTSVFGVAAFAQPAIGRAYLAGQTEHAMPSTPMSTVPHSSPQRYPACCSSRSVSRCLAWPLRAPGRCRAGRRGLGDRRAAVRLIGHHRRRAAVCRGIDDDQHCMDRIQRHAPAKQKRHNLLNQTRDATLRAEARRGAALLRGVAHLECVCAPAPSTMGPFGGA